MTHGESSGSRREHSRSYAVTSPRHTPCLMTKSSPAVELGWHLLHRHVFPADVALKVLGHAPVPGILLRQLGHALVGGLVLGEGHKDQLVGLPIGMANQL